MAGFGWISLGFSFSSETFGSTRPPLDWSELSEGYGFGTSGLQRFQRNHQNEVLQFLVPTSAGKCIWPGPLPAAARVGPGPGGGAVAAAGPFAPMVDSLERTESVLSIRAVAHHPTVSPRERAPTNTFPRPGGRHPVGIAYAVWVRWKERSSFFPSDPPTAQTAPATRDGAIRGGAPGSPPA